MGLSFPPRSLLQPLAATSGLILYFFAPQLGLLAMCVSILFEEKVEGTLLRSLLVSRLRAALLKMGVNRPTAEIICTGEFQVKRGFRLAMPDEGLAEVKGEHGSKMLVLENVVLLLTGLATVGIVVCYIVVYVYGGFGLTRLLFAAVPYTVFMARFFVVRRIGRFIESHRAELFSIALLALFILLKIVHLVLIPLLVLGFLAIHKVFREELKRKASLRREKGFLRALTRALTRQGLAAKAAALKLASDFGSLSIADVARNPSMPAILEHVGSKMRGSDNRFVVHVFGRALATLGYMPAWYRASGHLLGAYERLKVELGQQLAKNILVASVMFSVGSLSLTLLTGTAFFRFSSSPTFSTIPTLAIDVGYVGFSYIYGSETLYIGLFFAILLGEAILIYAI